MKQFESHRGFNRTFKEGKMTLGLNFPLEAYKGSFPEMDLEKQVQLARRAEDYGFASLTVRDAPLYDPDFGDVGGLYDPFMFLTYIAAHTDEIALATGSIVTTLRNPLHTAKSAATLESLSGNRFLFGAASGDRPVEFPAFKTDIDDKGELFRESLHVMRKLWKEEFPEIQTERVNLTHGDVVPKPELSDIPVFGTGYGSQTLEWLAENMDGWFFYPQDLKGQKELIAKWRQATEMFKPFAQPLFVDLSERPGEAPKKRQIGFRAGRNFLMDYLDAYQDAGVNHVMIGLKDSSRPAEEVIQELGEYIVPKFPAIMKPKFTFFNN
ncbi:LLM class oxidoreductase [Salinicoccus halodurans]|uniref:5,10-methylene tetrahydromethanopterin reductase n=1 Tax=Salinicoccus halodurans TaxID=407035 RepID=A0A0F7HKX7_9STAP|nr:LLM class oxidoreductase [Salinicoccus halodurans]AKG73862.1 5,10-methylene tetrahydromethanopterin reductase [Salinicoccus halodurans]SFK56965.1 luciferase-type oxidoreductase, BA3436 family [Salinicoccus halodurans]